MPLYPVLLGPIRGHEGKSEVELPESAAAQLLASGVIGPAISTIVEKESQEKAAPTDPRINLNTADAALLQTLPGIGKAIATKLIEARPFGTIDEARQASGLSPDQWAAIELEVSL